MKKGCVFKRCELKFVITADQLSAIMPAFSKYMKEDAFGLSSVQSLYYDTDNNLLIRRSLEKPTYKEKLRVRCYGIAKQETKVFVELKKKFDGVVFKRRINLLYKDVANFIAGDNVLADSQIAKEIFYFIGYYKNLSPKMWISYDRKAYCGKTDANLRVTFDSNIRYRTYDLSLDKGFYGTALLDGKTYIMEIKVENSMPLWLTRLLAENRIYKSSFSKYGQAYMQSQNINFAEENKNVG